MYEIQYRNDNDNDKDYQKNTQDVNVAYLFYRCNNHLVIMIAKSLKMKDD